MSEVFTPVALSEIRSSLVTHLESLPGTIDSYLEAYILGSSHYLMQRKGQTAGFASIHGGNLITQFALGEPYRKYGQDFYRRVCELDGAQSALVPTCDEFFLAHSLDEHQHVEVQAYFFTAAGWSMRSAVGWHWKLQPAGPDDIELIARQTGDFFAPLDQRIEASQIYLTLRLDNCVGFGILEQSELYADAASIGMFTIEEFRQMGVGTATITMLIDECRQRGLRPVAGCAHDNDLSKRALERAGMYSPTRLLRVSY
jgi:RimJ/RimL family protein N-acetyltransferase